MRTWAACSKLSVDLCVMRTLFSCMVESYTSARRTMALYTACSQLTSATCDYWYASLVLTFMMNILHGIFWACWRVWLRAPLGAWLRAWLRVQLSVRLRACLRACFKAALNRAEHQPSQWNFWADWTLSLCKLWPVERIGLLMLCHWCRRCQSAWLSSFSTITITIAFTIRPGLSACTDV